jgi:hypothetical protein
VVEREIPACCCFLKAIRSIRVGVNSLFPTRDGRTGVGALKWPRNGGEGRGALLSKPLISVSSTSMLPFAQEKRRKINLGGSTFVSSQTDILHGAKARRAEREEIRRRHESALRIQSRWRSLQQFRATKRLLSEIFQEDLLGIKAMRALVLIGKDEPLLAQWSEAVISAGDGESSICPFVLWHPFIYPPFPGLKTPTSLFSRAAHSPSH